jgi:hypothetical protein
MMVAPLLWFVSSALGPGHEASRNLADMLPPIAADPNRFLGSVLFGLLSLVLFVPAVLGVAQVLHSESRSSPCPGKPSSWSGSSLWPSSKASSSCNTRWFTL